MSESALVETFEAAVEPESLDLVQDHLEAFWARDTTVSVADRTRFEMAVVEIVGNILEHAFELDASGRGRLLTVTLSLAADQITALMSDNGLPAEIDLGEVTMPGEDATSGRGLALAIAAVDDVGYEHVAGRNHWRVVCRRTAD